MVKFVDAVTGEGIPDVEFGIYKEKFCISYDGCNDKNLENGVSNSEGLATFKFRQRKNGNHYLKYDAYKMELRGYTVIGGNQFSLLDYNKNDGLEIKLLPNCKFKLIFNNVNCFDANDKLIWNISHDFSSYSNSPNIINGCSGYSYPGFVTNGAGNLYLNATLYRNNLTEYIQDTFYLNPFEENVINIDY